MDITHGLWENACTEDGIKSYSKLRNVKNEQSESTMIMLDKVASIILLIL